MREGRIKEARRGGGGPDRLADVSNDAREETRTEVVGGVVIVSPPKGTPVIQSIATVPQRARRKPRQSSAGAAAAAAYAEPKTMPPVHQDRSDMVAVLLAADIDPQKVPTEPSLSRRDSRPLADIASLPPVRYQSSRGAWPWLIVAAVGGLVGYWVFARALNPEPAVQVHGQKSSMQIVNADSLNPTPTPQKIDPSNDPAAVPSLAPANEPSASAAAVTSPSPSAPPSTAQVGRQPASVSEPAAARPQVRVMSGSKGSDSTQPNAPASEKPPSLTSGQTQTAKPAAPTGTPPRTSDVWLE
jgi:hypothetical protein